jgi:hypothetical protein
MLNKLLVIVPVLVILFAAAADAAPGQGRGRGNGFGRADRSGPVSAPEFDAKASGAAVALLVGGAVVLFESRRGRRNKP